MTDDRAVGARVFVAAVKVLLLCLPAAGCDRIGSPSCTLIGCGDSLNVTWQPAADVPYQATLTFPGGERVAFRCSGTGLAEGVEGKVAFVRCSPGSLTVMCGGAPDYCSTAPVDIQVVGPQGQELRGVVTPQYSVSQPNGPDCAPTCKVGTASFR